MTYQRERSRADGSVAMVRSTHIQKLVDDWVKTQPTTTNPPKTPPTPTTPTTPTTTTVGKPCCGPDVTDAVFKLMDAVMTWWDKKDEGDRKKYCAATLDVTKGALQAWDITEFDPQHFNDGFKVTPTTCQQPAPQCSTSYEFLGGCWHPQVINYVLFGVITALCEPKAAKYGGTDHDTAHGKRSGGFGTIGHALGASPDYQGQVGMAIVGFGYARKESRDSLTQTLSTRDTAKNNPYNSCPLNCPKVDGRGYFSTTRQLPTG